MTLLSDCLRFLPAGNVNPYSIVDDHGELFTPRFLILGRRRVALLVTEDDGEILDPEIVRSIEYRLGVNLILDKESPN